MSIEKKEAAIKLLEEELVKPNHNYSLDDGAIIINVTYKSTDDILKAISYFKAL